MRVSHADPVVPLHVVLAARLAHHQQYQAQQQRSEVHVSNVRTASTPRQSEVTR